MTNPLNDILSQNNPPEVSQSTYVQFHSTDTALLRVQNDLLRSVDCGGTGCAWSIGGFYTIDPSVVLLPMHDLGVWDSAVAWFKPFLTDHHQHIYIYIYIYIYILKGSALMNTVYLLESFGNLYPDPFVSLFIQVHSVKFPVQIAWNSIYILAIHAVHFVQAI